MISLRHKDITQFSSIEEAFRAKFSKEYLESQKVLAIDFDTLARIGVNAFDIEALLIAKALGWKVAIAAEKPSREFIELQKVLLPCTEEDNDFIMFTVSSGEARKQLFEKICLNSSTKVFFSDKVKDTLAIDDDDLKIVIAVTDNFFGFGRSIDFKVKSLSDLIYIVLRIDSVDTQEES